MDETLEISFEDCSQADAARFAQDLEQQLRETDPSTKVSFKKERPDSQDFGATLVLVFGTPVAIALARGRFGLLGTKCRCKHSHLEVG
jgi:hypothetical protein